MFSITRAAMVCGAVAALLLSAGTTAIGQLQPSQIDTIRRQNKAEVDANSPLADRLFVKTKTRYYILTQELRVPQPRMRTTDFKDTDFFHPSRPNQLVDPNNPNRPLNVTTRPLAFGGATLVVPLPERTAGSVFQRGTFEARLSLDDIDVINLKPGQEPPYVQGPSGSRYAAFAFPAGAEGRRMNLTMKIPVAVSSLAMDERVVPEVKWPAQGDAWPADAKSALEPEFLIDYQGDRSEIAENQAAIDALLKRWLGGADPKASGPIELARELTGYVMGEVNFANDMEYFGEGNYIVGLRTQTVSKTLADRRGTEAQVAQLLVAVLRRVGLPARTVFGVDLEDRRKQDDRDRTRGSKANLRAWAEFAVLDPKTKQAVWIPIDIRRQRQASSQAPRPNVAWRFVGNHEDMEYLIPVAFHMHPPIDASQYSRPNLCGWQSATMATPGHFSGLRFSVLSQNSSDRDKNNPRP